jgi:membrane associated rhomboid family serine protease
MESYFMSYFGWPGVAPRGAVAGAIVGVLVAFVVPDKRRRRRDPDEPYGYADME